MNGKTNIFQNKITSVIIALIVCLFWGSLYPCIKIGYSAFQIASSDTASILLFAGIRFAVCGLILSAAYCIGKKKIIVPDKDSLLPVILVSFTTIVLHYSCSYLGLSIADGSKSAILKQIGFLFISAFAFLFIKEDKFQTKKLIAGILGFVGIIVINMDGFSLSFNLGDILILAASFLSVSGNIISKKAYRKLDPIYVVAYSQLIGGLILLAVGLLMGGKINNFDSGAFAVIAYICFASIIAYSLWNTLLKYNDLSRLSIIKFSEPLFAVITSGLLLNENVLKPTYLAALILTLASIIICNVKIKKN